MSERSKAQRPPPIYRVSITSRLCCIGLGQLSLRTLLANVYGIKAIRFLNKTAMDQAAYSCTFSPKNKTFISSSFNWKRYFLIATPCAVRQRDVFLRSKIVTGRLRAAMGSTKTPVPAGAKARVLESIARPQLPLAR